MEEWRIIAEFPHYTVSNLGRVKRLTPDRRGRHEGRLKAQTPTVGGYLRVGLVHPGERKVHQRLVHRLVAAAFLGELPVPDAHVCHQDGDPTNNALSNLRYDTPKGNHRDRIRHGTHGAGARNPRALLTEEQARQILKLKNSGRSSPDVAREFSVNPCAVQRIWNGRAWRSLHQAEPTTC